MRKTYTHIELLDRFMSGKTSPEEEQTLLAWFSDPDHKEEIMAFYKSRWEESSGKSFLLSYKDRCSVRLKADKTRGENFGDKEETAYLMEVAFLCGGGFNMYRPWNWLPLV